MKNTMETKIKYCESDGISYLSNPPKSKCKNCGQFWFTGSGTPSCQIVHIQTQNNTTSIEERIYEFTENLGNMIFGKYDHGLDIDKTRDFIKSEINSLLDELLSEVGEDEKEKHEWDCHPYQLDKRHYECSCGNDCVVKGRNQEKARWRTIINNKKQV